MSHTSSLAIASIVVVLASIVGGAGFLYANRQTLLDSLVAALYEPTEEVAQLAKNVTLTAKSQRVFEATQPELADADTFNAACPRQEEKSPILGCYTAYDRLYVYRVTNQELDGIEEVTTAHELLHAVWSRTDDATKQRLEPYLRQAYETAKTPELEERMAYYERNTPTEIVNELHSIMATEVADLDPYLENYYAAYFSDRQAIVSWYHAYNDTLTTLTTRADEILVELDALVVTIDSQSAAYDAASAQLDADITWFNSRANSGDFSSMTQFYSERAVLIVRSDQLENDRLALNANIDTYDALASEYEQIAARLEILNKSLDSWQKVESAPQL